MKNIFLSIILSLITFAGYSTSSGVEIINNSDCEIYLQIRGSRDCPNCEIEFISCMLVIPAGANITYSPSSSTGICGFPPQTFVNSVLIYSGPRHCQPLETWVVGDPGCYPPDVTFWTMNQGCERVCDCLHARWEPAECDGIARLIIERC